MSKKHIFVILALLATIGVIIILLFNLTKKENLKSPARGYQILLLKKHEAFYLQLVFEPFKSCQSASEEFREKWKNFENNSESHS